MGINPFKVAHIEAEIDFQDGRFDVASALVENEYRGVVDGVNCVNPLCNGTLWYKATVGAHKCPDCGLLAFVHSPDDIEVI